MTRVVFGPCFEFFSSLPQRVLAVSLLGKSHPPGGRSDVTYIKRNTSINKISKPETTLRLHLSFP